MASAQQQILNALQALLAAGGTVAGGRVFVDRVDPLQPSELPAIIIQEDPAGEACEPVIDGQVDRRELAVSVHCVISHSSNAAAQAREFGVVVEKLIAGSAALATLAQGAVQLQSSRPNLEGDSDRLLATRAQSWLFAYFVHPTTPDVLTS